MRFPTCRRIPSVPLLLAGAAMCAVFCVNSSAVYAQSSVVREADATSDAAIRAYWTPERLMSAKPMELHPDVGSDGLPLAAGVPDLQTTTPSVKSPGAGPSVKDPSLRQILIPAAYLLNSAPAGDVTPEASSSAGLYFTTSRVFPVAATKAYPNTTVGHLFFSDPKDGSGWQCSGSVLRPRIIVTAGHCIASPSTSAANRRFYHNWLFIPSDNNGTAPYGSWTYSSAWVTTTWYYSNGSVPNAQDVGMLVAKDLNGHKIGSITGYLGYSTGALAPNNITMLGYPCNLDGCNLM